MGRFSCKCEKHFDVLSDLIEHTRTCDDKAPSLPPKEGALPMARELRAGKELDEALWDALGLEEGAEPTTDMKKIYFAPSSQAAYALIAIEATHRRVKLGDVALILDPKSPGWRCILRDEKVYSVETAKGTRQPTINNTMGLARSLPLAVCRAIAVRAGLAEPHPMEGPNGTPLPREFDE